MSNDFSNLPEIDYTPESFGTAGGRTTGNVKPTNSGGNRMMGLPRWLWITCGGCAVLMICICMCCAALVAFSINQPGIEVGTWGIYIQGGYYQFAEVTVCEGSQAEVYTQTLQDADATFENFLFEKRSGEEFTRGTATLIADGVSGDWEAEFYSQDGGQFPLNKCINRIDIVESPDLPEPTPTTTETE